MTDDGRFLSFRSRGPFREKNLSIPAAAGSFSLDASSGLLATLRRFGAGPVLQLWAQLLLLWCELYDMMNEKKKNAAISISCRHITMGPWVLGLTRVVRLTRPLTQKKNAATSPCGSPLYLYPNSKQRMKFSVQQGRSPDSTS
jgi:hypothetical protein